MSFPLTPMDYVQPARGSDTLARISVAAASFAWLTVVAALFWN